MLRRRRSAKGIIRLREPTDDFLLKSLVPFALLILACGPLGGWGNVSVFVNIAAWAVLGVCGFLLIRSWRIGVYVHQNGIKICNMRLHRSCEWSEIESFSIGYPEARSWKWSPVATLTDKTRIPMIGIQAPQPWTRPSNDFAERAVAQLQSLLAIAQANGGVLSAKDLEFPRVK
jgi:hypothetical protein